MVLTKAGVQEAGRTPARTVTTRLSKRPWFMDTTSCHREAGNLRDGLDTWWRARSRSARSSRRRSRRRSTGDKGFEQDHQDGPTKKINAYGTLIVKAVNLHEAKSMPQPGREPVLGEGQPPRLHRRDVQYAVG